MQDLNQNPRFLVIFLKPVMLKHNRRGSLEPSFWNNKVSEYDKLEKPKNDTGIFTLP